MALARALAPALSVVRRPVFLNAAMLWGSTIITSVLGFGFWIAAARLFPIGSVGFASAAVSAMMLLAQFGLLGMGTLMIAELAGGDVFPVGLVSAATLLAGVFSFGLGYAFVALQGVLNTKLGPLGHGVVGPLLFAAGTGISAVTLVIDQASIGLNRGGLQLGRNAVFSLVKLVLLPVAALAATGPMALAIYLTWTVGNVVSLLTYWLHARRSGLEPMLVPAFRSLYRVRAAAFGHHWLNLAFQAPRLILPVIVAAALSPAATAAFYEANLIVSFVGIIPSHLSTALFALPHGDDGRLAVELRAALRVGFGVAAASAVGFALLAHPILLVFGHHYLIAATSMALLGLSTVPYTVKTLYAAVERVRGRLSRCATVSTAGGVVEALCCIAGVKLGGLAGVSLGLDIALTAEAIVLWPIVARAAGVPILGLRWLWRSAPPETVLGPLRAEAEAARSGLAHPGDAAYLRVWTARASLAMGERRLRALLRLAGALVSILRRARQIRREDLRLSPTAAGAVLEELMTVPMGPFRAPRPLLCVLDLPDSLEALLAAPSQRGLRARLDRAADAGVRLVHLHNPAAGFASYALARGRSPSQAQAEDPRIHDLTLGEGLIAVAVTDRRGVILAVALAFHDGREAYLARLVASRHDLADDVRWVLHAHLCDTLITTGVRRLWTDGPLAVAPDAQGLQDDFGYQCARVRLRFADNDRSG
ncbi:MAG TPA: lipopolysaccharide biosynthesis protein [Solirubrobacteraceae bacterium]|nr:lipopolysaccharide biosynthesis protein [Solirubrobacteraceae bacterium]